jgi:hypothetical protein
MQHELPSKTVLEAPCAVAGQIAGSKACDSRHSVPGYDQARPDAKTIRDEALQPR